MGMVMIPITRVTIMIISTMLRRARPRDHAAGAQPNRAMATMTVIMVITTTISSLRRRRASTG
jgi:hypothetical protein